MAATRVGHLPWEAEYHDSIRPCWASDIASPDCRSEGVAVDKRGEGDGQALQCEAT